MTNNQSGIYVYSYKHYLDFPVVPTSGDDDSKDRTYLKVGMSARDAFVRVKGQNTTGMPEQPLLLRIYNKDGVDLKDVEKVIHGHLDAADHNQVNRKGSGAGTEWYLTHLELLDSTASLLGLETKFKRQDEQKE